MSVWLDETENEKKQQPAAAMSDVSFRIQCRSLPVDHAAALADSIYQPNHWLTALRAAGVHPIHVAGSQNGWQRPDSNDQLLLLSKRTRLKIRIDTGHTDQLITALRGTTHAIADCSLQILDGNTVELKPATTLFSRYTVYLCDQALTAHNTAVADETEGEQLFIERVISDCKQLGFTPTKLLCGRSSRLSTAHGPVVARSILLADVPVEHSLALQDNGLGDLRSMGCGMVIPHKDTGAVNQT